MRYRPGRPIRVGYIPGGGSVPENTTTVLVPAPESTGADWATIAVGLGAGVAGLVAGAAIGLATRRRGTPARV